MLATFFGKTPSQDYSSAHPSVSTSYFQTQLLSLFASYRSSMFLTYALCFVVALLIHEGAHSLAAYACRVSINEFGFGWGPKVFGVRVRNVEYIFRAFPLGAYVRFDLAEL